MSFGLYIVGFIVLIIGLAWGRASCACPAAMDRCGCSGPSASGRSEGRDEYAPTRLELTTVPLLHGEFESGTCCFQAELFRPRMLPFGASSELIEIHTVQPGIGIRDDRQSAPQRYLS
jgi:hypothetical protein